MAIGRHRVKLLIKNTKVLQYFFSQLKTLDMPYLPQKTRKTVFLMNEKEETRRNKVRLMFVIIIIVAFNAGPHIFTKYIGKLLNRNTRKRCESCTKLTLKLTFFRCPHW